MAKQEAPKSQDKPQDTQPPANDGKDQPSPGDGQDNSKEPEVKQGVITSDDLSRRRRVRIPGVRGAYGDAMFGDNCETTGPVSAKTLEALKSEFGEAVEVIEEPSAKSEAKKE
jgi:hypothetical protein